MLQIRREQYTCSGTVPIADQYGIDFKLQEMPALLFVVAVPYVHEPVEIFAL